MGFEARARKKEIRPFFGQLNGKQLSAKLTIWGLNYYNSYFLMKIRVLIEHFVRLYRISTCRQRKPAHPLQLIRVYFFFLGISASTLL